MGVKQEKKHCDEPDWRTEILERTVNDFVNQF